MWWFICILYIEIRQRLNIRRTLFLVVVWQQLSIYPMYIFNVDKHSFYTLLKCIYCTRHWEVTDYKMYMFKMKLVEFPLCLYENMGHLFQQSRWHGTPSFSGWQGNKWIWVLPSVAGKGTGEMDSLLQRNMGDKFLSSMAVRKQGRRTPSFGLTRVR